jgi:hypothetical protein
MKIISVYMREREREKKIKVINMKIISVYMRSITGQQETPDLHIKGSIAVP